MRYIGIIFLGIMMLGLVSAIQNVTTCDFTVKEDIMSASIPIPKIYVSTDCDSIGVKNIFFRYGQDSQVYVDGLRLWWIFALLIVGLTISFIKTNALIKRALRRRKCG